MKKFKLLLLAIFCLIISSIQAQETPKDSTENPTYLVVKTDGNELYGKILSDDGREILLETKTIGKVFVNKSDIKYLRVIDGENENSSYGEYRETGPFTTRYAFTNNAFPIKKEESYALLHLYGPEVHFALTDNLSVGIMSTWIASPIGVAVKYSTPITEKTYFSLGTIMGSSGYLNSGRGYGGLHWGTITHGTRKANFSISAGYSYADNGGITNGKRLGSRYCYGGDNYYYGWGSSSEAGCEGYYIEDYDAREAVDEYLYGNSYNYSDRYIYDDKLKGAFAFGLSGIAPVGSKASFIFDSMTFLRFKKKVIYEDFDVTVSYDYYDPNSSQQVFVTETYTIGKGVVVKESTPSATIILMPGMRFNSSYDKAFQVHLAGVINISSKGDVQTFPFPMVSWLRRF